MSYVYNPLLGAGLDQTGAGGGGGTPGGSTTQVQFNDSNSFGGDDGLTFNKTTNVLTVGASTGNGGSAKVYGDINLDDGGSFTTTVQCVTPTQNRTISFPDATGTVALVAGSSGQLTYNNAGSNAGATGSVVDSSGNVTIGGLTTLAGSPSANNTSGVLINGTWRTGASSNNPQLLLNPSGTTLSTTWSTSGTGIGVNAPASFGGNLLDLQVNGTNKLKVTASGNLLIGGVNNTGLEYYGNGLLVWANSTYSSWTTATELRLTPTLQLGWAASGSTSYGVAADIGLVRSGTNTVKVTNGSTGDGTISGQLRAVGTAPASASATGTAGDIRYDADYIYVCTATNTWKRAALATW
jgi:hypothetical protein